MKRTAPHYTIHRDQQTGADVWDNDHSSVPGFCCVPGCGQQTDKHLCRACRLKYSVDGKLPDWLKELQAMQRRAGDKRRYRLEQGYRETSLKDEHLDRPTE